MHLQPPAASAAAAPAAPAAPARPSRRSTMTAPTARDPLQMVLDVLELDQVDEDTFTGSSLPKPGGRVFGGQVLAQSLLAAARTVPSDRHAHSVHGYFLRPGDVRQPITFAVERLRDGRSFSARRTHAIQ